MPARPLQVVLGVFDRTTDALLTTHLQDLGCVCHSAVSLADLTRLMQVHMPELAFVAFSKDGTDIGEDLQGTVSLDQLHACAGQAMVVGLAAPDPELFFRAAKMGVEAILTVPVDPAMLLHKLQEICMQAELSLEQPSSDTSPAASAATASPKALHSTIPSLFAVSEEMQEVREMIEKVAPTSAAVLICGESGVGKELAARMIHSHSLRSQKAFVKVNCAAIPNELLESELFGYEAGAFTGATKAKPGKFELADGGTIFLDEIGEMHPMLQAKLLHVLQDGDFARLGSKRDISVDVRVICATNRQLDQLVANGQFREDLYYRVNVVTVTVPPLRARRREIPVLLDYFVKQYAKVYGKPASAFDPATMQLLIDYEWPGNIRELENLCKRYVIVGSASQIVREMEARRLASAPHVGTEALVRPSPRLQEEQFDAEEDQDPSLLAIGRRAAWAAERQAIENMLQETRWNRREAARRLRVSYKALLNKIHMMQQEGMAMDVLSK